MVGELYHNKGVKKKLKRNCRNSLELKSTEDFGLEEFYHKHCLELLAVLYHPAVPSNEPHVVCTQGKQHPWLTTGSICVSIILCNVIVITFYSFRL